MDFDIEKNEMMWNWQELHHSLPQQPQNEISPWTNDTTATPVKASCVDMEAKWKFSESDDLMKEYEESRGFSSQVKRRKMLQFDDESIEFPLCTEELPVAYLHAKARQESDESLLPEITPWNTISSDFEMTESDNWLTELLNSEDMYATSNIPIDVHLHRKTLSAETDVHFSISDFCDIHPFQEVSPIPKRPQPVLTPAPKTSSGKVIFKGRTSYIKTPTKRASCVAYPFTFIKPCPMKGGMTLQDINRKILTPGKKSPVTPKLVRSAISGKLVVRKTRIRTVGKGSITITRTRG